MMISVISSFFALPRVCVPSCREEWGNVQTHTTSRVRDNTEGSRISAYEREIQRSTEGLN
jgi:hypothetical protein